MGLRFRVDKGSGRATCKFCKERIKKTETQITASGYQTCGSIHKKCATIGKDVGGTGWN